jgi:hypothetical protein
MPGDRATMYIKIFRYRVLPQKSDAFLAIQQQAAALQRRHLASQVNYYRQSNDPNIWMEVHRYEDAADFHRRVEGMQRDPEMRRLWQAFQGLLDPNFPPVLEQYEEREAPGQQASRPPGPVPGIYPQDQDEMAG